MHSFAVDFSPLKIHIFAVAIDRIIITAQKFALIGHHRFFPASRTTRSHSFHSITQECYFFKGMLVF